MLGTYSVPSTMGGAAEGVRMGEALRLASDDLYDCRWRVSHRFGVADDARPRIFFAKIMLLAHGSVPKPCCLLADKMVAVLLGRHE